MPFLHLLYYHKADVTSQTFGRSRQNDVLHGAFQSIGHVSPKTGRPAPGGDPTRTSREKQAEPERTREIKKIASVQVSLSHVAFF